MDENYEWDSEFPGDMELLETWHPGLASSRTHPELEPELGMWPSKLAVLSHTRSPML